MYSTPVGRCLVILKRIAAALERLAPPPTPRSRRPAVFSIATDADFTRGYDDRTRPDVATVSEEPPQ